VVRILAVPIDGSESFQPIAGQQATEVVLAFDLGEMERTRRNGRGEVIVPVIVVCEESA
jgi:hypothetical protein